MRLSAMSTLAEVERFWEQRSVAVEGHQVARLGAVEYDRRSTSVHGGGGARLLTGW